MLVLYGMFANASQVIFIGSRRRDIRTELVRQRVGQNREKRRESERMKGREVKEWHFHRLLKCLTEVDTI